MWTVEDRERYKDDGRRYPSDLTDAEWELVRSLFETYPTLTRDIRAMVDGCLYLGAEGCRWRSLPEDFGPWQTVRGYWDRFRRDGVWADVAALLTPPARGRIEATFGTLTNRYRRLTRNLEQSGEAAENVVELANLRRVLRVLTRLDQNLV